MNTIVFELNEVPWQVMDWYCDLHPRSAFARIRRQGRHYQTVAEDRGHLHPWVTWPSLHRGVSDERHGIQHLGQNLADVNEAFPPVWEMMRRAGHTIGIAGSLQSYPAPAAEPSIAFYVPDTFAASAETVPPDVSAFQEVSLLLTRENGRNVKGSTDTRTSLALLKALPKVGLTAGTMLGIGAQLVREKTDKTKLNRRRAMQSALYFDLYARLLRTSKPQFSTFFTNHVAATMHRFWAATFPNDYTDFELPKAWSESYAGELEWAMGLADGFAARLIAFCERETDFRLIVCSSMGQAASTARVRAGIYQLKNVDRLFEAFGVEPGQYRQALAMAPAVSVHLLSERAIERVRANMPPIVDAMGGEWDIDERGMLHIAIKFVESPESPLPRILLGNRLFEVDGLGFEFVPDQDRVATTAYHVPEGILMHWDPAMDDSRQRGRETVSALEIAPALLAAHQVALPDYLKRPSIGFARH